MKKFNISPVKKGLKDKLQRKIDNKTKPLGALGRLEEFALKIGLIQQTLSPALSNPIAAVFAGDHGIAAKQAVSAYPREVTAQMVRNYLKGGAAVNVFCRMHGINPKIVDAGVAAELPEHPQLINRNIAKGTRNYAVVPAMSSHECEEAVEAGMGLVNQWHRQGANVIAFGEMGIANTSSASVITSLITGTAIEKCTGKGTGLDKEGVRKKTVILKAAIEKHQIKNEPWAILSTFGGFEIAMMIGAMLEAAEKGMILLVDGFIVTAALLIAHALYPEIQDYVFFAHESEERGHQIQLRYLDAAPMLRLGMRLGEGTGAVLAYPILSASVKFLNEMASFEGARVSNADKG